MKTKLIYFWGRGTKLLALLEHRQRSVALVGRIEVKILYPEGRHRKLS